MSTRVAAGWVIVIAASVAILGVLKRGRWAELSDGRRSATARWGSAPRGPGGRGAGKDGAGKNGAAQRRKARGGQRDVPGWRRQARALGADVVALADVDTGTMRVDGPLTPNDLARYAFVLTRASGSLLDVGCGRGLFLDAYPGTEKAGVDIKPLGEHSWPIHVGNADALPFPDAAWDTVSAQEMLEHQTDEKVGVVLAELRRVTRERLLITVPFCQRRLRGGHLQRFEAERLREMFPTARFTILDKGDRGYPWVLIEEHRSGGSRSPA